MAPKPGEQFQALKVPLIITAVVFVLLVGGAFVWHLLRPPKEPLVVEAKAPAEQIRNIVFSREDNEYVLYFSLGDKDGNYVARPGEVSLKISQLGTIGIEDGPQFVNETTLLEAKFEVELHSYRWIDIGGAIFFTDRQLIIPKRIAPTLFKLTPRPGQLGKISVRFRDGKAADSQLYLDRRLLFP
ncbi:MAG: hypothetical protein EXS18_01395 [Verrucomicrobiae bacterium]|nr:hypothetical protein [Verrucomicrobiae bacterium]